MRKLVLVIVSGLVAACGSSSSNNGGSGGLAGTVGGHAFKPVQVRAISLGTGTTPCELHLNPIDPSEVTTVGVKAVEIEVASFAEGSASGSACADLSSSQCRFHAGAQTVTILIARVNIANHAPEPPLAAGTYTASSSLSSPSFDASGAYVAFAQALSVDPTYATTTGVSVAGTVRLDQVGDPLVGHPLVGHVSLGFDGGGSSLSGDFSAALCAGPTQDVCTLAQAIAISFASGQGQGLCTPPALHLQ